MQEFILLPENGAAGLLHRNRAARSVPRRAARHAPALIIPKRAARRGANTTRYTRLLATETARPLSDGRRVVTISTTRRWKD